MAIDFFDNFANRILVIVLPEMDTRNIRFLEKRLGFSSKSRGSKARICELEKDSASIEETSESPLPVKIEFF